MLRIVKVDADGVSRHALPARWIVREELSKMQLPDFRVMGFEGVPCNKFGEWCMLVVMSCPFHHGSIFAAARSLIAPGSMIQSLLCRRHAGLVALPNLQSRLLDGAGKRKRQRSRQA